MHRWLQSIRRRSRQTRLSCAALLKHMEMTWVPVVVDSMVVRLDASAVVLVVRTTKEFGA